MALVMQRKFSDFSAENACEIPTSWKSGVFLMFISYSGYLSIKKYGILQAV
jgi:hypothetical protein